MKEILEALTMRIKSPIFGYFIISFVAFNWKVLFFLFFDSSDATTRITFFEAHTSTSSLLIIPLAIATAGAILYPWVNYIFLLVSRKPTELKNSMQVRSEHFTLIEKQNLQEVRNKMLEQEEFELIGRAKRDQEIENIENEELRNSLQEQINELRNSNKDSLINNMSSASKSLYEHYISQAQALRDRGNDQDAEKMYIKAVQLEQSVKA